MRDICVRDRGGIRKQVRKRSEAQTEHEAVEFPRTKGSAPKDELCGGVSSFEDDVAERDPANHTEMLDSEKSSDGSFSMRFPRLNQNASMAA